MLKGGGGTDLKEEREQLFGCILGRECPEQGAGGAKGQRSGCVWLLNPGKQGVWCSGGVRERRVEEMSTEG